MQWTTSQFRQARQRMVRWYNRYHRPLPWRETHDPYTIWVSEIMLQQTQVVTVLGYYDRFLARFPSVFELAAAPEQDVLALWSGLGYYRRARQMHAAAKVVVDELGGDFPKDVAVLQSLPGIGRYTAGAIASFAFDRRAPILEANTARLFSRLVGLERPVQESQSQQQLWEFAERLLPDRKGAGITNQAAMELGSQVCAPVPDCDTCPLIGLCVAHAQGKESTIPVPTEKAPATPLTHIGLVIWHRNKLLLRQNEPGEWWQGLWDLPRIDVTATEIANGTIGAFAHPLPLTAVVGGMIADLYRDKFGIELRPESYLLRHQHSVTRYRITLHCFSGSLSGVAANRLTAGWEFYDRLNWPPLTAPAKKVLQRVVSD